MPSERSPLEAGGEDGDKNHRHRLQDDATLENSRSSKSKRDPKDHDDRRTAARDGRHSGRRLTSETRLRKDSKGEERTPHKAAPAPDTKEREGKSRPLSSNDHQWKHDKFSETTSDPHPPTKKRRPFREEKLPSEPHSLEKKPVPEPNKVSQLSSSIVRTEKWEEKARDRRPLERNEQDRAYMRDRSFSNRGRVENIGVPTRERFENDGKFKGRGSYRREQGSWLKGGRAEKWKHDLFDEANRSPSPKKEEDPVAKVEALLSM